MRFSERYGYKSVRELIQIESMDDDLRNGLWNCIQLYVWNKRQGGGLSLDDDPRLKRFCVMLWLHHYKRPLDTLDNYWQLVHPQIRGDFFKKEWFWVYDFIEFLAAHYPYDGVATYIEASNQILKREGSAYRFVDRLITRVTTEEEVAAIETSLANSEPLVRTHLRRALELLSDRDKPDYRNSIKESISAIESQVANTLGQTGTLGELIKKMQNEIGLHSALGKAFRNFYGYTSDESGIRHALMDQEKVSHEDAKFFLVICSAFASYVDSKLSAKNELFNSGA